MTNLVGELPFAGTPPEQDFAKPNEMFFAHVDRVVAETERQGILLARCAPPRSPSKYRIVGLATVCDYRVSGP